MGDKNQPQRVHSYGGSNLGRPDDNAALPEVNDQGKDGDIFNSDNKGIMVTSQDFGKSGEKDTSPVISIDSGSGDRRFQFLEAAAGNVITQLVAERPQLKAAMDAVGLTGEGIVDFFVRQINKKRGADFVAKSPVTGATPVNGELMSDFIDLADSSDIFATLYNGRRVADMYRYDVDRDFLKDRRVGAIIIEDAVRCLVGGASDLVKLKLALSLPDDEFNSLMAMQGYEGVVDHMTDLPERADRLKFGVR